MTYLSGVPLWIYLLMGVSVLFFLPTLITERKKLPLMFGFSVLIFGLSIGLSLGYDYGYWTHGEDQKYFEENKEHISCWEACRINMSNKSETLTYGEYMRQLKTCYGGCDNSIVDIR